MVLGECAVNRKTIILGFDMETDIGSWTLNDRGLVEGSPHILRILRRHDALDTFLDAMITDGIRFVTMQQFATEHA